jgi:hypothetical protein
MLRRAALVRTDVSEELSASFIRVARIGELGTTLAVTSNRRTHWRNTNLTRVTLRNIREDAILHNLNDCIYILIAGDIRVPASDKWGRPEGPALNVLVRTIFVMLNVLTFWNHILNLGRLWQKSHVKGSILNQAYLKTSQLIVLQDFLEYFHNIAKYFIWRYI